MSDQKIKSYRSRPYLTWVQGLPCSHCFALPPNDAHHVQVENDGGMGTKPPDFMTVPLCRLCHGEVQGHSKYYPEMRWLKDTLNRAFSEGIFRD